MLTSLSLSSKKYDEIAGSIRKSFPNSCILWIDQVSNPTLEAEHGALFESLKEKRGYDLVKKLELFHGTTEYAVSAICQEGFDVSKNTTSAYGKGTYFARDASYSFSYSQKGTKMKDEIVYMLVCSVIVGVCSKGSSEMVLDTGIADTMVDNSTAPSIYVTPYDKGGIPKYVVAFHKNPSV